MIHHDNRPYEAAASEAAKVAREKFGALIAKGRASAGAVIETIQKNQPVDRIVPGKLVAFADEGGKLVIANRNKGGAAAIHDHALGQVTAREEMPWKYVQNLRAHGDWGRKLLIDNLNTLMSHDDGRYLLRFNQNDGRSELRGFLSDKYRRLDARPITDAFIGAATKVGALPYEGVASDTRVAIRAIVPNLFEPVPNEVLAFGLEFSTSDYGDGALSVAGFILRMLCTNLATMEDVLRKVHLGARLGDDLTFSQQTYEYDTKTMTSAVGDIVEGVLAPEKITEYCEVVRTANDTKIDAKTIGERMKRLGLTKAEQEAASQAFNEPNIEIVPSGQTVYRMSNAISWVAGNTEDPRRKLELQKLAGVAMVAA